MAAQRGSRSGEGKMNKRSTLVSTIVLVILLLSVLAPIAVLVSAAPEITISTDKALYAIIWAEVDGTPIPMGYVDVTVTFEGLTPAKKYRLEIAKIAPPAPAIPTYVREISGASSGTVVFTIPPTKDSKPDAIAGTWRASIYDTATNALLKNCTFGIWAINSPTLNYYRLLKIWGGGASPESTVEIVVDYITEDLFGETPIKCKADSNGVFSNVSKPIPATIPEGIYSVTITSYEPMDQPDLPIDDTLEVMITSELLVRIIRPEDKTWRRTETIPLEVEVLYQDYEPMTAGTVYVSITTPEPKTVEVSLNATVPGIWIGSYKTYEDNATGIWTFVAYAEDGYGNSGTDTIERTVDKAILVVSTLVEPQAVVPRATWATWRIRVTYHGDDRPVELYLPGSYAYVVNATDKTIVGSAIIAKITNGVYNVTWFVPPDAAPGSYQFLIKAHDLKDSYDNTGPDKPVNSTSFTVSITTLVVEAETYSERDPAMLRKSFVLDETVWIGAKITYADSGVVMSVGVVTATISNATWSTIIDLYFDTVTRMWWGDLSTAGMTAGRYDVVVTAYDTGNNTGIGTTFFFIAGFIITPTSGTVPPEETITAIKVADTAYLVRASIYVEPISGKSLGTVVTVKGVQFTPNSKVNVTVTGLPYLTGYTVLVLMNVPTDAQGVFTASFVFPTAPKGTYSIIATDAKGVSMTASFEVEPGLILTPGEIVGSGLIRVIGTGYPSEEVGQVLLIDETDALTPVAPQVTSWITNANGTIVPYTIVSDVEAKPAFILPLIEPKTYTLTLYIGGASASDTVKVVNDIKEITRVIQGFEEVKTLISGMSTKVEEVAGDIAIIKNDLGYVKIKVDDLMKALSGLNAIVTDIEDGVAKIKTDVGDIKTRVGDLKSLLNSVGGKVDTVSGDIATIKTDVGTIRAKVDVLDAISSKVDTVSGKVDTISGKVDTAASAAEGAAGAVAGLTTAVWIAVVLSLIAAIASIVAIIQVSRKIAG